MQDFPLTLSQGADERMLKALIAECWAQDPAERPAFDGILERISASLHPPLQITVMTLEQRKIPLDVLCTVQIKAVKAIIEKKAGIPVA